ncbi:raffinose synthase or seed imbibition protein Sip1-domain-containing protein, partial [Mycotypha africana]|uniref:raffinose synthase or seed imbibition protein Sip1-domain-containing protein n=1 Tax=Mycotypha africana TaxID=64632 RepID=UPI0023007BEC
MLPTILLTPDIDVDIIITGYEQRFPLRFYCYCSNIDCQVELWTNIPTAVEKEWKGVPFSEIADQPQHYQLDLDILHVPPGVYEFTLRFIVPTAEQEQQSSIMPQWVWYGKPGQNGILRILPCPTANIFESPILYTTLPELKLVNAFEKTERRGTNSDDLLLVLHHFRAQSSSSCIPLHQMNHPLHSYVAFIRKGSTWLTPVAGMHHFHDRNPQEKWQCLLYQDLKEGKIHLWMAVSQNSDCWLSPATTTTSNMTIAATGLNLHCPSGKVAHLLIVSSYASPTAISTTTFKAHNSVCQQLFQLAVSYYEQCIKKQSKGNGSKKECQLTLVDKFEPFVAKQDSFHVDKLGFCTWNAFKKEVSMEKIEAALTSFEQQQIPIQYLLIDDGWQSTSPSGQMLSFDTFHCRFGDTLQNAITNLKRNHPLIQHIGVWHTLAGYWYGMDESFAKNSGYSWTFSTHQQDSRSVGLVTDPHQFYEDFYKFLKSAGVDFVKVDNQGGFQDLRIRAEADNMSVWDAYRKAMVQNADRYLNGQVIHCMALTPHILFDLYTHKKTRLSFRNSDDFFPDVADSHAWHIYANAINSLLTSQYPDIISDWDMFQSDHPFAEFHATARAISGGPIYITDVPLKHNKQLIMKLVAQTRQSTYSILRFSTPPQPSFDTVFGNPMGRLSILSLYNKHCEDKENNAEDKAPNCICSSNATVMEYGACGFWNPKSQEQLGAVSSSAIFGVGKNIGLAYHVARIITGPEQG